MVTEENLLIQNDCGVWTHTTNDGESTPKESIPRPPLLKG